MKNHYSDRVRDVVDSELEISELSASGVQSHEKCVDSVISPVDLTELVMSLRDRVVSVALVAVDGTVWLSLLVTTVALLVTVLLWFGSVSAMRLTIVLWLGGGCLVALLVSVRLGSGCGGLVAVGGLGGGFGLVGRSLRSGEARVILVRSKSGGRMSSGVVTVGGVRVVGSALKGSLLLSLGVTVDVGSVGPWVLGVLTVEMVMDSVS